jgi:aminopeptidase N
MKRCLAAALALVGAAALAAPVPPEAPPSAATAATVEAPPEAVADEHSFANLDQFRVTHFDLDLTADFDARRLQGSVTLYLARLDPSAVQLVLDTRDLRIGDATELSADILGSTQASKAEWVSRPFHLGRRDPIRGSPLIIDLPPSTAATTTVKIEYETAPGAPSLQWLTPAQSGTRQPFLYTQGGPLGARGWIPLQDSPQVRTTYRAVIHTPDDLVAVMGSETAPNVKHISEYVFVNPARIPPGLVALAVGDLGFKSTGPRTGVYALRHSVSAAAREFAGGEAMLKAAEMLFGAYRFGRFDILVMPPAFPGIVQPVPRLPFVTATLLAGDKSLVPLIVPALAAEWAGDLVGNATWRDDWLRRGFTTYRAHRLEDALYGAQRAAITDLLAVQSLRDAMARMAAADTTLAPDLHGRDPATISAAVSGEKGGLFLGYLAARFGAPRFDEFLRGYAARFAFQSLTTERFLEYLQQNLLDRYPGTVTRAAALAWIMDAGLPGDAMVPSTAAFDAVDAVRAAWLTGPPAAVGPAAHDWTVPQWEYFLDGLPADSTGAQLAALDKADGFSKSDNAEITASWLAAAIRSGYSPADKRLETFLRTTGRRDLVVPLYQALMKTPAGTVLARRIYPACRAGYHDSLTVTLDPLVLPPAKAPHP